jgi:hypothetical protein
MLWQMVNEAAHGYPQTPRNGAQNHSYCGALARSIARTGEAFACVFICVYSAAENPA